MSANRAARWNRPGSRRYDNHVEIFFIILLVLCSLAIVWFGGYTVMRMLTNESRDQ